MTIDDLAGLRHIISQSRRIAVVGLSAEWHRPSYFAAKYMQAKGYRIHPINPRCAGQMVLGEPCVARLEDVAEPIDIVDVFRRSEGVGPIAESAIAIGAKCLWQQIGVTNADARASAAGLASVMNRCVKIEHARIFGGLHRAAVDTGVVSARRGRGCYCSEALLWQNHHAQAFPVASVQGAGDSTSPTLQQCIQLHNMNALNVL